MWRLQLEQQSHLPSLPSFLLQIEDIVTNIQHETEGVPIRTVKSFMTKIPSVVTGEDMFWFWPSKRIISSILWFSTVTDTKGKGCLSICLPLFAAEYWAVLTTVARWFHMKWAKKSVCMSHVEQMFKTLCKSVLEQFGMQLLARRQLENNDVFNLHNSTGFELHWIPMYFFWLLPG